MCEAVLGGLRQHLDRQGGVKPSVNAVPPGDAEAGECPEQDAEAMVLALLRDHPKDVYDVAAGQILKKDLVAKARQPQMVCFEIKKVWEKRQRAAHFGQVG